jgi:hypothetical protein
MRAERDASGNCVWRSAIRADIFRGAGSAGSDLADFVITTIFAVHSAIAINSTFTDDTLRADRGD